MQGIGRNQKRTWCNRGRGKENDLFAYFVFLGWSL